MKIIGCIFIFLGCTLMGYMKANSYKKRVVELENIIELIKLLEIEIIYRKENLKKAFIKVSNAKECWFSNVLKDCGQQLSLERPFENSWKNSIKTTADCPLVENDLTILNDLASTIGRTDALGQIKAIEPTKLRLNHNLESAKANYIRQGKMYKGLGLACGATFVILLI